MSREEASLTLDHVGYIVPDLAEVAAVMEALGFVLTPRAEHTRTLPDGTVASAGSAQRSLMLRQGYIEFMEIFDPSAGHMLASARSARDGLHILALGTSNADTTHAGCTRRMAVGPVLQWSRPGPDSASSLQFRFFGAPWQPGEPSYLCWVEHLTPAALRPAGSLGHRNGADTLVRLAYRGGAIPAAAWAQRLQSAGAVPQRRDAVERELRIGNARVTVLSTPGPAPVVPHELTLSVARPERLCADAKALGIPVSRDEHGTCLDLRQLLGMRWHCVPTPDHRSSSPEDSRARS